MRGGICVAVVAMLALALLPAVAKAPAVPIAPKLAAASGSWPVYHHDDGHTGYDSTLSQVQSVTAGWTATLDATQYASPLVYNGIVYAATLNNTIYAFNQSTGALAWSKHLRAPETSGWTCGGFQQGILGTPVIDVAGGRIYAATLDGNDDDYRVEGLNLATGAEELNTIITLGTGDTNGFNWRIQNQRGALAVANGYVYVPFGGRAGDCGNYHGYVYAVPTSGGAPLTPYITAGIADGFWAPGGVVVNDSTGKIFVTSGNGTAPGAVDGCAANGDGTPTYPNDEVIRLSATLTAEDHFAPQDWHDDWCINDEDLGSATPVLLSSSLMFQAGKWGMGFLLNPASLGGMNGQLFPSPTPSYVEQPVCFGNTNDANFGSYAYAAPFIYLECHGHGLVALSTNTSTPSFSPCGASCPAPDWHAGGTGTFGPPIVAGGAVWVIDINGGGLYAFNSTTGAQIYHSGSFSVNHFVTPAEAGGQVFVPADNVLRSFNMNFGCTGTPLSTLYFSWFDRATPGMVADNIHILNTGASTSSGCVTLSGYPGIAFTVGAGQETHVTLPSGYIGGPLLVTVNSGPPVQASQRVQYYQSFNEVWAMSASQAATTSYLSWFDRVTPGMVADNIHVLNPGGTTANVTVSMPGASPIPFSLAAGAESYVSFGTGHIGGPVTITADQPVLASQRVQYYQTFNEVVARSASQAATTSYFNWFDRATAGMVGDNIHLVDPGATLADVSVSMPGATTINVQVPAGGEQYVSFGVGHIGGPVTVTSDQPVLASQRVQYYHSFNETASETASQALTTSHIMWFDRATPGMVADNIHVLNAGGSPSNVTVALAGAPTQSFTLAAGAEMYVTFPAGNLGGPVTITGTAAVLAAQRVQYYQTFNEVPAA